MPTNTKEMAQIKEYFYYDVVLQLPFFEKQETTKIKISATSLHHLFTQLENDYLINLKWIEKVYSFKISKTRGNTRIDFQIVAKYTKEQLRQSLKSYAHKPKN